MITQNIDNYHSELLQNSDVIKTEITQDGEKGHGFTNGVLEIHGNLFYMRWFNEWNLDLYSVPPRDTNKSIEDQIPKCTKCGEIMRPHILWFDESYTSEFHRLDEVQKAIGSSVDALIVVGTALATTLAFKLVREWLKKDILTIDVNLDPVWTVGHSVQVVEKAEKALPNLFKEFIIR